MNKVKVTVGNKTYNCKVASTSEELKKGLMGVEYLAPDEGMLFDFRDTEFPLMWMKNCPLEIDLIFINDDDEVILVYNAQPNDEKLVGISNTRFVLEVNANSGIVEGDEFDIDDDDDLDKYVMKVLAPNGSTQMLLQGGERIVSRKETRTLIRKAKRAYENKDNDYDRYCKALGRYVFKVFKGQDNREPEYVLTPSAKERDHDDENE